MVRSRISRGVVPAILLIHFAVAVWLNATLNVWIDESYSMHTTARSLAVTIQQTIRYEEQPPFYFVMLWCWRSVNESVFWGRLLSSFCAVGFLAVAWRVVHRLIPAIHPAWIIGPMAVNPAILHAATEMRPPAMALFVSGLLIWSFYEGFLVESPPRRVAFAYGVLSVIALYTHYYLGFLLLGNGIALLLTRRWQQVSLYYGLMGAVAVCYLPMMASMADQRSFFVERGKFALTFSGGIRLMIERVQTYLWPADGLALEGKIRWIVPGLLATGTLASLYVCRERLDRRLAVWLAVLGMTAFGLSLVAWQLGWQSVMTRHAFPVLLPAYICLYAIVGLYQAPQRRIVLYAWTLTVLVSSALALHSSFRPPANSGDWKRVAAHIEANEKPNQPILLLPAHAHHAFMYHYKGTNDVVPLPKPDPFVRYNHPDDMLRDERQIRAALESLPYHADSIWVVANCDPAYCGYMGVSYGLDVLDGFLTDRYAIADNREYHGVRVQQAIRLRGLAPMDEDDE